MRNLAYNINMKLLLNARLAFFQKENSFNYVGTHYPHYYENVFPGVCSAADEEGDVTLEDDIGKSRDGSRTDDEAVQR